MGSAGIVSEFHDAGATLVVEEFGAADAGTVFVLLHGIGMGRKVFAELITHLSPHGRVIALDLPGYGDAPEPARTPTMERMADFVAAMLRSRGLGEVVVIGHSMGTQVAVELAVRHPAAVARVVLVGPTVDRRHRHAGAQLWRLALDLLNESPKVLLLGAREYVRAGPHLRRKVHAMLVHRPERVYPAVRMPTLVVRGEHDLTVPPRWFHEVVALLPDARTALIAGHGHETLIRDAEPAAREILRFVD
ncbi:alpha/beta hydrolase [Microbacterium sp. W1N]|uniref:alpha/beta fold hydrolase n=1 Tax=Microbacterium festucae TaxID=2977531 RepID=UPI0021BF691C|nr:alpha/beta hydrolase [Microbacterium festucae]MCT9820709.1 alpha/beta hydrolase [Microbacterium festucae]